MSRERAVDVLIVGAGPAGSAAATLLARQGLEVLAVDRARFPREKPCSEYMSPESCRVLHTLGVLDALEAAGAVPLAGTIVNAPMGGRLHGRFDNAAHAPFRPHGLAIARRVLDHTLVEAARAAGAEVLEGTALETLTETPGGIAGATVRTPDGALRVRARLTIGADGLRSVVARRLGQRRHGWPRRVAMVAHVEGVPGLTRTTEMHVSRHGYVGLNPIGHGVANVALVIPARRARAAAGRAEAFFHEELARFPGVRGRVDRARTVREVLVTGPFSATSSRVTADGALLTGDAADFFDPFTGEGICTALRGAELIASAVGPLLAERGDAPLSARALAGYVRARRRAFLGKWMVERLIGYAMFAPPLFDRAVRRMGSRPGMADTLIGVTGDFVPARAVLNPLFLARMLF